jgi:hypothetical protein
VELEHLKIKTRLINEKLASVKGLILLTNPPRDGKDVKGFLPHWTNSILQQVKKKILEN